MAVTMARRLGVVLESREEARLSVRQQVDPAALELYLKGVEAAEERTAEGLESAIGFYRLAAAKDPRFPQAYSGVAAAELLRSNYAGVADTSATYVRATEAADRAIRLAPELADAWATRAFAHYVLGWNWSAAESDFRHAIRLEPQSATAHHWYADYLSAMGRFDESIQEARKALDRTPASVPRARDVAWQYFYARRYDEAVAMLRELAQQHPEAVNVHTLLGRILVLQGQYSDGVHHLERAVALARSATPIGAGGAAPPVFEDGLLAFGYAASGRRADAERILSGAAAVGYRGPMHLCHVAAAFGAMGEFDRAFDALDRAFAARETSAVGLRSDPLFDSLRPDVRFTDLVKRMRFPE
jgi:tetratricopeptide (TPR) repeat protein